MSESTPRTPLDVVRGTRLVGLSREEREAALAAFARIGARMAQLERVAQLARAAVDPMGQGPRADRLALLDCALVDLDNHPATAPGPNGWAT